MTTAIINATTPKKARAKKRTFRELLALFDSARPYRERAAELRAIADRRRAEYEKARAERDRLDKELAALNEAREYLVGELKRLREDATERNG